MEPEHSWIRKAFPHVEPGSPEHAAVASKLRRYIEIEEGERPWQLTRNLALQQMSGLNLQKEVETVYNRKRRKVRVFEVGCGRGHTLRTLKIFTGSMAQLDGITLTQKAADHAAGKHDGSGRTILATEGLPMVGGMIIGDIPTVKVRTGIIEGLDLQNQDLIYSFQTMRYVIDRAKALEVIANGLAKGGKAILHVPNHFLGKHERHVKDYLERNGVKFRVKRARNTITWPRSMKPGRKRKTTLSGIYLLTLERNSGAKVDLSRFYKIRTRDHWQDPNH